MTALQEAPLFQDIAPGPAGGSAWWLKASDGVRIRIGIWQVGNPRGTVLLFPGRTEYIEKYGDAAREFGLRGYSTLAIDWRGQGLADRLIDDTDVGYVAAFSDYLCDVDAVVAAARAFDLPKPWHLLGHSMGGGIGLCALMKDLPVESAAFTGPMWGIRMRPPVRAFASLLGHVSKPLGLGTWLVPSTRRENYVMTQPFEDNALTRDQGMYEMMQSQISAHPDLAIGGPTLSWLREAMRATDEMAACPAPNRPALCILGSAERIVDTDRVRARMDTWPDGELLVLPDAEHEVMMERQDVRQTVFDRTAALFDATAAKTA